MGEEERQGILHKEDVRKRNEILMEVKIMFAEMFEEPCDLALYTLKKNVLEQKVDNL